MFSILQRCYHLARTICVLASISKEYSSVVALDPIDRVILDLLQADGRMTHAALAEQVHLSPSACLRRVKRLERAGVIEGYRAALALERVGLGTTVFVEISLTSQQEGHLDEFEDAVMDVPEVISCHLMAGDADYLIQVVVADVTDYERVHRTRMARLPHVAKLKSSFALRGVVTRPGVALASEAPREIRDVDGGE